MAWRLTPKEEKIIALAIEYMGNNWPLTSIQGALGDDSVTDDEIEDLARRFQIGSSRGKAKKTNKFVGET